MKPLHLLTPLLATLATAPAVTRTWDGGDATANWAATANWNPNAAIAAGDALLFPSGLAVADRSTNNNFAAGAIWAGLTFNDGGYTLNGNQIQLTNSLTASAAGTLTVNADLLLGSSLSLVASAAGGTLDLTPSCTVNLNGHASALAATNATASVLMRGPLTGTFAGNLNFTGPGTIDMRGAKTFTANPFIINGAQVLMDNDGSLGQSANIIKLANGTLAGDPVNAILHLEHEVQVTNDAGQDGIFDCRQGALSLDRLVTLSGTGTKEFRVPTGRIIYMMSNLNASSGQMIKTGLGTMYIAGGPGNNVITGPGMRVNEGVLRLDTSNGRTLLGGTTLNVGNSDTIAPEAEVRVAGGDAIDDATAIRVNSDGVFTLLGDASEVVSSLAMETPARITTGTGELRLTDTLVPVTMPDFGDHVTFTGNLKVQTATQTWVLGNNDNDHLNDGGLVFTGTISGSLPNSTFVKDGSGDFTLRGNQTIPRIRVLGTFGINIMIGQSPNTDVEAGGLWFLTSGSMHNVTVNTPNFVLDSSLSVHNTLECADLTFLPGSRMSWGMWEVTPEAGETHDIIRASGAVTLAGTLDVYASGVQVETMVPGDVMTVISKSSPGPVTGIFDGLPEGAIVQSDNNERDFVISYKGGDGNDVTLTQIIPPTGVTRTWDGGSNLNGKWTTAANWVGDVAPQPGDALRFPAVAARKDDCINDFPAGTTFQSVTVVGSGPAFGYGIFGNRITLNEKLDFASAATSHMWGVPLTLAQDVLITAGGSGFHQVVGTIDTHGHDLTLFRGPGGTTYMSDTISGSGDVIKTGTGIITYFEQAHTYSGTTFINEGVLALKYEGSLGSPAGPTIVAYGAVLELRNNEGEVISQENIQLAGTIRCIDGTFPAELNGTLQTIEDVNLDRPALEANGNMFSVNGAISGDAWRKTGPGLLTIGGTASNANSSSISVEAGELRLAKIGAPALGSMVAIGTAGQPATVSLGAPEQIPTHVQFNHAGGVFNLNAYAETVYLLSFLAPGTVTGTPVSRLTIANQISVPAAATTAVIAAPLTHTGTYGLIGVHAGAATTALRIDSPMYGTSFRKFGDGRMDIMASIPQDGLDSLTVTDGSALFFANCRYTDISLNGGTVGGQGVVGNIVSTASGGTVSPGTNTTTGGLGAYGSTWNGSTTFRVEINGTNPGGEFDQLAAFAPLDLGGSKLTLLLPQNYDPAANTEYMIVRNVSGQPVSNTFAGLPENGYVSAPGAKVFRISYHGGDGDDVVLTKVDIAAPELVFHGMTPGTGEHKGENDTHMTVKGTPGLLYQLEYSTNLLTWTPGVSKVADLQTGLMEFDFFSPENDPRLFLRVKLP